MATVKMRKALDYIENRPQRDDGRRTPIRQSTIDRVGAIAWATIRHAKVSWKSDNVNETLREYIAKESGYLMTTADVWYAMKWFMDRDLAWAKSEAGGKRYLEFGIKTDVDLTGFPKPEPGATPNARKQIETAAAVQRVKDDVASNGVTPAKIEVNLDDMPLPGPEPEPDPPYLWERFSKLLWQWAEDDPDAYARYVEGAIARLETSE